MEDKEIDFLVGEYLRFWGELGIEDLASKEIPLRGTAREAMHSLANEADAENVRYGDEAPVSLDDLRRELGTECGNPGCTRAHKPVFGAGNPRANLMFVGEAPGAEEDQAGLPFLGADGQLLTKIIEAMGLTRDQTYLTYAAKCGDSPEDSERCAQLLSAQISAIRPRCIIALGPLAAKMLLGENTSRGAWHPLRWNSLVPVMPTLSPTHLLSNAGDKKIVWEDMKKVKALLEAKA